MTELPVLYFTAPWCAPCKKFRPVVDKVAAELGLELQALNIDTPEGARLAASHNVTSVPTLILRGGDGSEGRWGVMPPRQLRERLASFYGVAP